MYHNFITKPTPAASETAIRKASIIRETPESISPDRKSLMELVIATPGTNIISVPIMMELYDAPGTVDTASNAMKAATPQQQKLMINGLIGYLPRKHERV